MAKEQIKVLKKKLDNAKKARDQVEQDGYDVGVAETAEALRDVEHTTSRCGIRPSTWSGLRRVENVYYPPIIRAPGSSIS